MPRPKPSRRAIVARSKGKQRKQEEVPLALPAKICSNTVPQCLRFERPSLLRDAAELEARGWAQACHLFPSDALEADEPSDEAVNDYGGNAIKLNYDRRLSGHGCLIVGAYQNVKTWGVTRLPAS